MTDEGRKARNRAKSKKYRLANLEKYKEYERANAEHRKAYRRAKRKAKAENKTMSLLATLYVSHRPREAELLALFFDLFHPSHKEAR